MSVIGRPRRGPPSLRQSLRIDDGSVRWRSEPRGSAGVIAPRRAFFFVPLATDNQAMALSPDYYSVLGVLPTADRAVIHSAWKALLRRYHPDANHGVDVSARAKEINEAYAVLGKKETRAAYDRSRRPMPSSRPTNAHRSAYATSAGRRPIRRGPSLRSNESSLQPLQTNEWLIGLLLLLLTAAPLGVIMVLLHEEAGSTSTVLRDAAAHRDLNVPNDPARASSGTKLRRGQPAP